MRTLLTLLAVASMSGQAQELPKDATCALDSARAVDDLLDAIVYIFASMERCTPGQEDKIRCTMDVSATIESVNKAVNIIVAAVQNCGKITTAKPLCGQAIGLLTRATASVTSASAGIAANCEKSRRLAGGFSNKFGQCAINVKDSIKSLFKTVKRAMVLSDGCTVPDSPQCGDSAILLVDALTGLAEYISGAVAKCDVHPANTANAACAQMTARLSHALGDVSDAGIRLDENCKPDATERLFLANFDGNKVTPTTSGTNSLTVALAAFLPITAVVAFVGGKRLAKVRSVAEPVADEEMLVQE